MEEIKKVIYWALNYEFTKQDYEYATTLTLKILDKKCKMSPEDQEIFMIVYDSMLNREDRALSSQLNSFIQKARDENNPFEVKCAYSDDIHNLRVKAEESMQRPIMKAYKAMVREELSKIS